MVYVPTVLFALGEGAVIPLIPVIAAQLGADVAGAALVASALVVGQLAGNLPAGWAVARFGERVTMGVAGALAMVGVAGMIVAPVLGVFAAAVLLIGLCAAAFGLARHSFMTTRVPLSFRSRAMSLLGGTFRLGMFVGPFIAAALLALAGCSSNRSVGTGTAVQKSGDLSVSTMRAIRVRFIPCTTTTSVRNTS